MSTPGPWSLGLVDLVMLGEVNLVMLGEVNLVMYGGPVGTLGHHTTLGTPLPPRTAVMQQQAPRCR